MTRDGTMSIVLPSLLEDPQAITGLCEVSPLQLQLVLVLQHVLDGHASQRPSISSTTGWQLLTMETSSLTSTSRFRLIVVVLWT